MSERESGQGLVEGGEPLAASTSAPVAEPPQTAPQTHRGSSRAAPWLAGLLILVIAAVGLSPFWAPQIAPLLPWGDGQVDSTRLEARLAAVEARPEAARREIDAIQPSLSGLTHRVGQLETALEAQRARMEQRPATPSADPQQLHSALGTLTQRVEHLEAAAKHDTQSEAVMAAIRADLQRVEQRLTAMETQSASRAADAAATATNTEQQLAKLGKADADLAHRVAELERQAQSQSASEMRAEGMLALLLAQMREAVEQARPFPAEFDAFVKLAPDPELAAAVRPLAEAARNGVASPAVLDKRLAELAAGPPATKAADGETDWGGQALARLRGLVTIRRLDGAPSHRLEAAAAAARGELARGDLAAAVGALDQFTGANAEALHPWLQMAHERLAVETTLDHVQKLLVVRLGGYPAGTAPANAPEESEKAKTRS